MGVRQQNSGIGSHLFGSRAGTEKLRQIQGIVINQEHLPFTFLIHRLARFWVYLRNQNMYLRKEQTFRWVRFHIICNFFCNPSHCGYMKKQLEWMIRLRVVGSVRGGKLKNTLIHVYTNRIKNLVILCKTYNHSTG